MSTLDGVRRRLRLLGAAVVFLGLFVFLQREQYRQSLSRYDVTMATSHFAAATDDASEAIIAAINSMGHEGFATREQLITAIEDKAADNRRPSEVDAPLGVLDSYIQDSDRLAKKETDILGALAPSSDEEKGGSKTEVK